jgi:hypothetical protein
VLVEGQRAQHDGVHHRKDGRAGANAERQNRQRDSREGRRLLSERKAVRKS